MARAGLRDAVIAAWRGYFATGGAIVEANEIRAAASAHRDARSLVHANAITALSHVTEGALPRALVLSRRAALMARSEGLAREEMATTVALARVRRHSGQPHLALHLLNQLPRAAERALAPWLTWERLMAGADGEDLAIPVTAASARRLRTVLLAVRTGDRDAFADEGAALVSETARCHPQHVDALTLLAAFGARVQAPLDTAKWCRGEGAAIPAALQGLAMPTAVSLPGGVLVAAQPEQAGARILARGAALLGADHTLLPTTDVARTEGSDASGSPRVSAGVAALALAGPAGLDADDFFERVYGFKFQRELHEGARRVLLHRMRAKLEGAGEITTATGRLCLRLFRPVLVPDPRCVPAIEAQVLWSLAALGGANTELVAARLGLSERTMRDLLAKLVSAGVCRPVRDGRRISYRVDDSVVTAITRGRFTPP